MVAASAKAAMKPKAGCTGSSHFAVMKTANVAASTSVAKNFTRRSSAARAASPGVSMTKVPGRVKVMMAFQPILTLILSSGVFTASRRMQARLWPHGSRRRKARLLTMRVQS